MSEQPIQNLKNHANFDPSYHFFSSALLLAALALSIGLLISTIFSHHELHLYALWMFIFTLYGVVLFIKVRVYPLKVQDRIIRLEERLRLAMLLDDNLRPRIHELTEDQLIALRFASDEEIPKLVHETLEKKLTRKEIKERIENWRPDHFRV